MTPAQVAQEQIPAEDPPVEPIFLSTPSPIPSASTSSTARTIRAGSWRRSGDLRVGGVSRIRFGPSHGELYEHRHVFRAIERPRRILIASTEIQLDGSSFETTLEYTFKPRDGGTLMTMSQGGFPADELRDEHTIGVPHSLDRLERVLDDEHA